MTAVLDRPEVLEPTAPERPARPAWERPALLGLLGTTALLYLWNLAASGYANSFYAAAVQAGSQSWKAWFFGSLDAGNAITVDKPPAALWVAGLSARIFGFNSWSLLAPQALMGVAAVGLLYAAVRRVSGPVAGLIAGAVLALTPAAALMFRFDNPDALLVLLMVAGGYAVVRALDRASARWLALAGVALGFAFLTKMLQGFLVLPAFALVYLVAAPTTLRRRLGHLLLAGLALVVAAGWWVVAVALWPASARPYIGGSTDNSVLDLVFGYNGLGRIFGGDGNGGGGGGGGGGAAGGSFGGATGLGRLFGTEMGNEISWLLPAAIVALVAGLWVTRAAPRTDRTRAALLLWGGWLVVTALVFSYMEGTIHPYYTVALAPAIGGLIGTAVHALWRVRASIEGRIGLAAMVAAAAGWSIVLLTRVPTWHPELRYAIVLLGTLAVVGLLVPPTDLPKVGRGAAVAAVLAGLLGTGAFAVATAASPHTGSIPSVGPTSTSAGGFGGGGGGGGSSTSELTTALAETTETWAAATTGSQSAAELSLASGKAVIAIGGFSGTDQAPTLAQFQAWVAEGKIHYYVSGSGMGGGGGIGGQNGVASQISEWVQEHYTATTIGGQTVYDLTEGAN